MYNKLFQKKIGHNKQFFKEIVQNLPITVTKSIANYGRINNSEKYKV